MPDTHNPFEEEFISRSLLSIKAKHFIIEGHHEEAIEAYNNALSINPNYAEAYYSRGIR